MRITFTPYYTYTPKELTALLCKLPLSAPTEVYQRLLAVVEYCPKTDTRDTLRTILLQIIEEEEK